MFTLDAYAARSCPLKTLHSNRSDLQRPDRTDSSSGLPGTATFVAEVLAQVSAGKASVLDLREQVGTSRGDQQDACVAGLTAGFEVVIGGLLPPDPHNHRRGRADLLIRDPEGGYWPGIVKFQRALDPRRDDKVFTYSLLGDLPTHLVGHGWRYRWHCRWANAIQLAHLWHLLGPIGYQSAAAKALVIGTERIAPDHLVATWLNLDEPAVPPAPAQVTDTDTDHLAQISALERYRFEFDLRVELAQIAMSEAGPDQAMLRPIVSHECSYCDWWPICRPLIEEDDLSLRLRKSPLDRYEIANLRSAGVTTVSDLANADLDTLLPTYLPLVAHRQGAAERLQSAQRRSVLLAKGVELSRITAGPISVPRAKIEIDIDVETSREDRVYLWGFWISEGDGGRYHHFSSFSDLDDASELDLAREAMAWLRSYVGQTEAALFHYSDYEVVRLARLAASGDPTLVWAHEFTSTHFVDLFDVIRKHFFGANGLGLKAVASAGAGFHWRDDEPGGLNSMRWFDTAVHAADPETRGLARERVLRYNEDDVRATAELRNWLRRQS